MRGKRAVAALAGLALAGLALTACSSGNSPASSSTGGAVDGKGKTITIFTLANTQYPQQQKQFDASVAAAFKKQTGATLVWDMGASANDEQTKIQTSAVSGQGPDVYDIGTTFTPTAYSTGDFVSMTTADWNAVGGKSKFVPASLGISGPSSKDQIGIPYESRPFVMAYNTKLFQQAGLTKPATTWDGLIAQAKKLTGNGNYGMAVDYKDSFSPWKYVWMYDMQMGNPLISGKKATLDDAKTMKAYQDYFGLLTKDHVVDPASVGWTSVQALAAFAQGKAAMLNWTTATAQNTLNASPIKGDYKFAVMPTVPPGYSSLPSGGNAAASIISGDNLVVAKYSKNQALDFALVKYLTSDSVQQELYSQFGNLPVTTSESNKLEKNQASLAPLLEAGAKSVTTPFSGAWGATEVGMLNVVTQAIPSLNNGSVSDSQLKGWLTTLQNTANQALQSQ
ncbi:ABC transporter substrate-binding protein [Curtobacterium ammoniigenes]|uniref:ABC transporter substrate-binding protein n=1 Tax=Curtobacterium ammoniigenes TaxID=395387 RepID=UPI000831650B|nr:extracellular solute-binding protein [Curtobacterium ammoniigenes]